ncbi:LuxR C-terminal-related transcriptional regulator [uncultured Paludibaculum sp.]|uniref:LuxR C-terminal-related transcriptional regulator n=1 Tax=uncultured Paludibaculum sp. TaxID=1765020 RepID=UPI00374DEE5A
MLIAMMDKLVNLPKLTHRELTVLECLGHGTSNKELATALNLTDAASRIYVSKLMRKTGLNRHQLGIVGCLYCQRLDVGETSHSRIESPRGI